jgi:hypothetical protein
VEVDSRDSISFANASTISNAVMIEVSCLFVWICVFHLSLIIGMDSHTAGAHINISHDCLWCVAGWWEE